VKYFPRVNERLFIFLKPAIE